MIHLLPIFQPSIKVLERITNKAHWSLLILLFVVCFLFTLGGGVFYDRFILFGDRLLTLQDIRAIVLYNIPEAALTPLILCALWMVQYLVIRLLRGQGDFLKHGWVNFICFTPFVIVGACILPLPINLWTTMLLLLLLLALFYMCVLNIWMMGVIHRVRWKAALASTLLGYIAMPIAFIILITLYFQFGVIAFPGPS